MCFPHSERTQIFNTASVKQKEFFICCFLQENIRLTAYIMILVYDENNIVVASTQTFFYLKNVQRGRKSLKLV